MEERRKKRLEIVSKIDADLVVIPDEEIIIKFFSYVYGALSTFVDHPIGEEKPSYITAIDYVLSMVRAKNTIEQQEIFKDKWLKFKEHISEFARVDENLLGEKNLLILSELEKEKDSGCEEIVLTIRKTLSSNCADIWKETQDYEDVLSDRAWSRASRMSEDTGRSPFLFLD